MWKTSVKVDAWTFSLLFILLLLFKEKQQKEEEMRKRDMALDYLAPFLARIGGVDKFSRNDAMKVKEECLNDLKQRLIHKANLIQARFEKVGRPRLGWDK